MRLWLSTCLDNFASEFNDIEEMFMRGLSRLILQKRSQIMTRNSDDGKICFAAESEYDRWLMALPLEYRDRIWVRGTPDMAERLEVRGCVCDCNMLAGDIPERWKRVDCVAFCHKADDLGRLPEWVSAALVGPVYQPQSVYTPVETLGAQSLAGFFGNAGENHPRVIAFGGIDHENLDDIKKLPLQGISVLGGIWNYADPVNAFVKLGRACNI